MEIPEEIKDAVSAVDHDLRWRILTLVQEKDKLAYTELLKELSIRKGSLTHHLNKLMEAGLLDNYAGEEFGDEYSSYYKLSLFGKDFIEGLLSSVQETWPFRLAEREPELQLKSHLIETLGKEMVYVSRFGDQALQNKSHRSKVYQSLDVNTQTERYLALYDIAKRKAIFKNKQR